jgi:hypothetical protein
MPQLTLAYTIRVEDELEYSSVLFLSHFADSYFHRELSAVSVKYLKWTLMIITLNQTLILVVIKQKIYPSNNTIKKII